MDSAKLTELAKDLQNYLEGKLKFYVRVGWMRETGRDALVVYYDERCGLPRNVVPAYWQRVYVKTQPTLPPGVQPGEPEIEWVW